MRRLYIAKGWWISTSLVCDSALPCFKVRLFPAHLDPKGTFIKMIRLIMKMIGIERSQLIRTRDLAGIQYRGESGSTSSCVEAITALLSCREPIKYAYLITSESMHAFVFATEDEGLVAIKPGFRSGYAGQGPRGLAVALKLLERHKIETDEYTVDALFMERLEQSCLLQSDIDVLQRQNPIRPQRWYEYMYDSWKDGSALITQLSHHYPLAIPFAIIDERILDLAVDFLGNEDASLIAAYRRLEDVLRKRTGLTGEGTRLFSRAFLADDCPLRWDVPDDGEGKGRANLFNAAYMAFRNARVHREGEFSAEAALRELLLINELYKLEAEAFTESELKEKREEDMAIEESLKAMHGAHGSLNDQ